MKHLLSLLFIGSLALSAHAQTLLQYHGPRNAPLLMPGAGADAVTQYAVRLTPPDEGFLLSRVDLWLDGIVGGAFDTTLAYHGPEAAFAWPIPFTHVPETFQKQAVRFTAPGNGRLKSVDVFVGSSSASEDGFNDSLKIRILPQLQSNDLVVKYGTEHFNNTASFEFNVPVLPSRTGYATRFTPPATADSFWVNKVEFFVTKFNSFLPNGDAVPNDTLRISVFSSLAAMNAGTPARVKKVPFQALTINAWNSVSLFDQIYFAKGGTDMFVAFDVIAVGAADRIGLASGVQNAIPLLRTYIREDNVWKTLPSSNSFGSSAPGAELWTRLYIVDAADPALGGNDPQVPNESLALGSVSVPMSSLTFNSWNTITLPTPVVVTENQELWASAEVVRVGGQDVLAMLSHFAEPRPRFRTAVYLANGSGGGIWRYMQNSQFRNEYVFRMKGNFGVDDETGINDDLILVLYENTPENLPGNFINAKFIPLADLEPGMYNPIDVSGWNYRFRAGVDAHIAVSAEFETNSFTLAGDNGIPSNSVRTSAFKPNAGGWTAATRNLLLNAEVIAPTSIDSDDDRAGRLELHQNYPNPFNPMTVIRFDIAVQAQDLAPVHSRLAVYDLLGREVAVLVDGVMAAGSHQVSFDGSTLSSGIYLVRLTSGLESRVMRMTLLK
jgi:hypothetical protein